MCPFQLSKSFATVLDSDAGGTALQIYPPWAGNKKPGAKRRAVRRYAVRGTARGLEPNLGCVPPTYETNLSLLYAHPSRVHTLLYPLPHPFGKPFFTILYKRFRAAGHLVRLAFGPRPSVGTVDR
jgi:hypothetical protein